MEKLQSMENKTLMHIVKGVLIALITTILLLIIFAAMLTFTNIQENVITPVIIIITAISILIGSSIGNRNIKKNGILNGGFVGGIYMITIYFISSLLNWHFALNLQSIIFIVVCILCGILGGIIGVNKN